MIIAQVILVTPIIMGIVFNDTTVNGQVVVTRKTLGQAAGIFSPADPGA